MTTRSSPRRAAVVEGLGACVPDRCVTNEELGRRLDTSDEWIRTRTGIRQRFVVTAGSSTSDLAVGAGRRALDNAGTSRVDVLVLATATPDRPCPATAPDVATRLGLTGIPAFDVAAVCSGFVFGLAVAAGMISAGTADRALVIGADTFSTIVDPDERTTAAVFGDGAGAVVLRAGDPDENGALNAFDLGSDGALADLITVRAGGSRERSDAEHVSRADRYFAMQGREVFSNAVLRMTESATAAMKLAGWSTEDVDIVVAHQANLRILHAVADQLDIAPDRFLVNLDEVANTAAASIPLALAHGAVRNQLRAGQRVILVAFGGGATWGAAALRWPHLPAVQFPSATERAIS